MSAPALAPPPANAPGGDVVRLKPREISRSPGTIG
jgi:hypothetical protein